MRVVLFVTVGLLALTPASLPAADGCDGFTWNVAHERSLFASRPHQLAAGKDAASAPRISVEQLYEVGLAPQSEVHVPTPPEHQHRDEATLAGTLRLRIPEAGLYRVSLSERDWIDLVHEGATITSKDHEGRPGCSAPHKVVQFELPAGEVLVQLSGATSPTVRVTVTRAPRSASAPAR